MRHRGILIVLLVGAPTLALIAAPAVAQAVPPPAPAASDGQRAVSLRELVLMPQVPPTSEKELAGLSERASAEVLTWERAYTLALVRTRSGGTTATESLDPQALAEQARRHGVADFGRFRKELLAGRAESGGASTTRARHTSRSCAGSRRSTTRGRESRRSTTSRRWSRSWSGARAEV